jgi:hypothetical protein
MRATNLSGEVWDFADTDVFLVDPADEFADDRVYDSPQQTVFSFVIQSRRAPPVTRATISNRELTIVEHQGDAQAEFTLPVGTNSVEDLVRTLAIDPAVGSPGLNAEWDWDATFDAAPLQPLSGAYAENANGRSIRIRLNPQKPPVPNKPGEISPTFPVSVRYAQKSRPWESTYQLYLQTNASGQHFAHALRGFYLFENNSGVNWNRVNVSLVDAGSSSEVSQLKVNLPHSKARLALQNSRPLDSTVEPFLIFDPTVNAHHPKRNLRITNSGKTTLMAGRIAVIEDGKDLANFEVSSIKPSDKEVIAFPGDFDSRVCLTRLGPSTSYTYEARCLRGRCMEIVPLRRTQTIRANFNSDYASKEPVPLSIRLPKEECWQRVEQTVSIGATSPEQIIEVQQMRGEGWKYESLDLCSDPLDVLKAKQLDADDPYQPLLQTAITLRESGQVQKLQQLLQLPDLIVERAHAECCPLKGGMVVRLTVTVANLGGAAAIFRAGDVMLAVEGADPVRATQNTSFSCCERRVFQLTLRNRAIPPEVKVRLQVDPDNKVNEWNEADNVDVRSLAVKP